MELIREGHREKVRRPEDGGRSVPSTYEKLTLNLSGKYSRRITIRNSLVYEIRQAEDCRGAAYVLRMKGHYKGIHSLLAL